MFASSARRTTRVPDTIGVPHVPVGRMPQGRKQSLSGLRPRTADL